MEHSQLYAWSREKKWSALPENTTLEGGLSAPRMYNTKPAALGRYPVCFLHLPMFSIYTNAISKYRNIGSQRIFFEQINAQIKNAQDSYYKGKCEI